MTRTSPRTMARAYRIWWYCSGIEWDCTVSQVAEALDIPLGSVSRICQQKGWINRLRSSQKYRDTGSTNFLFEGEADLSAGDVARLV